MIPGANLAEMATHEEDPEFDPGAPFVIFAGWDDAPHLTEEMKREFLRTIPPNMIPARTRGVPYLGAGAIYPIPIGDILEDPFPIPDYWPRVYALDVGWRKTAALWAAFDLDADVIHLYDEHYAGAAEPLVHAHAIMGHGSNNMRAKWIPGLIDPKARGRNEKDGSRLMTTYQDLGLDLEITNNAVEAGISEVWQRLSTGRLKVFKHLTNFQKEYCIYRRKEDGKIVKKNDHLQDACRYIILSGASRAKAVPRKPTMPQTDFYFGESSNGWMGA